MRQIRARRQRQLEQQQVLRRHVALRGQPVHGRIIAVHHLVEPHQQLVHGGHLAHAGLGTQPLGKGLQVVQVVRFADAAIGAAGHRVFEKLHAHQVLADALPGCAIGCLSGPSFAQEVAAGLPAALTAASGDAALGHQMVGAFHHSALRTYRSTDIVGVEVGGALKNIMAVATGVCDGLGLGLNARSALLTRGLAEITRFGLAQGAEAETFLGLAGVGDLVLTCTGDLSRNRRVGLMLAKGHSLADILAELGHVAEGVACCPAVVARAEALQVDLPISWSVQQSEAGERLDRRAVEAVEEERHVQAVARDA